MTFLSLCLVSGIIIFSAYRRSTEREEADWMQQVEAETDRVTSAVEPLIQSVVKSGYSIFEDTWYKHYRNIAGIYAEEFTSMRRYEIVRELQRQVHVLPMVYDILVITPSMDSIISSQGWLSMDKWLQSFPHIDVDSSEGFQKAPNVTVIDDDYCAIVLNDTVSRRDKSVVCILMYRYSANRVLSELCVETSTFAEVIIDGHTLARLGQQLPGNIVVERRVEALDLSVRMAYKSYAQMFKHATNLNFLLLMVAAISLSGILSFFITLILIRPINKLIAHLGGRTENIKDPYRFIYAYLDDLSQQRTALSQENNSLRESRRHMLYLMRNEIIMSMLTNADFNFDGEYVRTGFSWMLEGKPFVMAACTCKQVESHVTFPLAKELPVHCVNSCCAYITDRAWYIYWFNDEAEITMGIAEIENALQQHILVQSSVLHQPQEIHKTYLLLNDALSQAKKRWLTLPTTVQGRLLNLLHSGKYKECSQAISNACQAYNPDAVLGLLIQVATDCGFDASDYVLRYRSLQETEGTPEAIESLLEEMGLAQCRFVNAERPNIAADLAQDICAFVEEHFSDPEISVNFLADLFSVHRTMISKAVKMQTGETFSDYLMRLRMEAAVQLIRQGKLNFQQISEQLGFLNYPTFLRAFTRTYGCVPSKWTENNQ